MVVATEEGKAPRKGGGGPESGAGVFAEGMEMDVVNRTKDEEVDEDLLGGQLFFYAGDLNLNLLTHCQSGPVRKERCQP